MNRRDFLVTTAALATTVRLKADATQSTRPGVFPASVRADFPSVLKETFLNSGSMHPVGTFAAEAGTERAKPARAANKAVECM